MGPRGQVVIPASARKELGLESGDSFLVFKFFEGKALVFLKMNEMERFFEVMSQHINQLREQVKNAVAEKGDQGNLDEHS
jgi:AbrB family looped-hinge helix DNA binding protein